MSGYQEEFGTQRVRGRSRGRGRQDAEGRSAQLRTLNGAVDQISRNVRRLNFEGRDGRVFGGRGRGDGSGYVRDFVVPGSGSSGFGSGEGSSRPGSSARASASTCSSSSGVSVGTTTPSAPKPRPPRKQIEVIRTRPAGLITKHGISGKPVTLQANYFKLLTHTDWALYQYRVDFAPEEDRTAVRKSLLRVHKDVLGGGYVFDGTVLFSSQRLAPEPLELYSKRESDQAKICITIKKAGDLVMGDHHYIQLFNILMRKCLDSLQLQLVGRNFFDAKSKIEIREYKMELWPGYLTSIRQHEDSILMCAEITHKVMRRETVFDLLNECVARNRGEWKNIFQQAIIGTVVLTEYNNRTYRVDDVDFDTHPGSKFKLKNSEELSYMDYYHIRYELRIKNMHQPMLVSKAKPRDVRAGMTTNIYLVPELCRLTGLTDEMRSNFQLMRALAEHTRVIPQNRIQKLNKFSERLLSTPSVQEDLTLWNMKLSPSLVDFEGRILAREDIIFGAQNSVNAGEEADWTRNMRSSPMLNMGVLTNWAVIFLNRNRKDVQTFLVSLLKSATSMNFTVPQPIIREITDDRCGSYVDALDHLISQKAPQLIMCIVPNNRADRYSAIKKKCCVDRAVPTQVVVAKNLTSKGALSIATKIAIQINCKIGGTPWTVNIPMSGLMVVGYDVCHDTSNKGRSFGAMVASLNKGLSRYYSAVSPHTNGEELSNDLSVNISKAVMKYKECNEGLAPSCIIIYRDGVGEGQIPFVYNHEVNVVKDKLASLYGGQCPRFAFVIVTKRLNTRLFLAGKNPPPGTIADKCITSPDKYDFFLVSQSVRQGTVSPTAYNVIDDSSQLDPDKMQRLTYKMTHLYFNWSGTVRVPAQCQYAHKLAFLVGQSLHRSPNNALEDLLYFL